MDPLGPSPSVLWLYVSHAQSRCAESRWLLPMTEMKSNGVAALLAAARRVPIVIRLRATLSIRAKRVTTAVVVPMCPRIAQDPVATSVVAPLDSIPGSV